MINHILLAFVATFIITVVLGKIEMCIRDRYNIVISTEVLNILDIKYVYKTNQEVNYGCT